MSLRTNLHVQLLQSLNFCFLQPFHFRGISFYLSLFLHSPQPTWMLHSKPHDELPFLSLSPTNENWNVEQSVGGEGGSVRGSKNAKTTYHVISVITIRLATAKQPAHAPHTAYATYLFILKIHLLPGGLGLHWCRTGSRVNGSAMNISFFPIWIFQRVHFLADNEYIH